MIGLLLYQSRCEVCNNITVIPGKIGTCNSLDNVPGAGGIMLLQDIVSIDKDYDGLNTPTQVPSVKSAITQLLVQSQLDSM